MPLDIDATGVQEAADLEPLALERRAL